MGTATWTITRNKEDRQLRSLALAPLFFGLQQGLEGLVWLGIQTPTPPLVGPVLYAALIVVPLQLVPSLRVRAFAVTLLLSFALSAWANRQALTSLWCYTSALLSAQVLWILLEKAPGDGSPPPAAAQA